MREECLTVGRRETAQMASCCQATCSCARSRQQWHTDSSGTRTHWGTDTLGHSPTCCPTARDPCLSSCPGLWAALQGAVKLRPAGARQAVNSISPCYWHPGADLPLWTGLALNAAESLQSKVCVVSTLTVAFDVHMAKGRVWKLSPRMGL